VPSLATPHPSPATYNMAYLAVFNLALSLIGLWQVSLMKRRITIA